MPIAGSGESPGPPKLLSIGELAELTGMATTALRYYDEIGLVRPATRSSARRRYAASGDSDGRPYYGHPPHPLAGGAPLPITMYAARLLAPPPRSPRPHGP